MQADKSAKTHAVTHAIRPYAFQKEKLKPSFHCLGVQPREAQRIQVNGGAIIAINQKPVAYPSDVALIHPNAFKLYQGDCYDDLNAPMKGIDRCAQIDLLCPPIIINLRENADAEKQILKPHEIAYFKKMGQNATLFIHGYNVPLGEFPQQVIGIKSIKQTFIERYNRRGFLIEPILGKVWRTFYRSAKMITDHFGYSFSNDQLLIMQNCDLNGSGACAWFVHMEDNLNLATGQFYRNNYLQYMRLIHVTWSGDVGVLNYMVAEDKADLAAKKLLKVIYQLIYHHIEINIIAHSLGNRILLSVMNELGYKEKGEKINHVFLCQAAVPNTALSNNINKDTTIKNNGHFPYAYKSAKKITVFFSTRDKVLKKDYYLANVLGISPQKLTNEYELNVLAKKNAKRQLFSSRKVKIYRRFLKHILKIIFIHEQRKHLLSTSELNLKHLFEIDHLLNKIYKVSGKITEALGYSGPEMNDMLIQKLIKQDKLFIVNTTEYIHEHSAMKIPTNIIIEKFYKTWIVGNNGIKKFGLYRLS